MTVACPKCETHAIIPARERNRAEEIPPDHNVACAACGESWTATPYDLVVVECAQIAWEFERDGEEVRS